jgi:hypothetical protein
MVHHANVSHNFLMLILHLSLIMVSFICLVYSINTKPDSSEPILHLTIIFVILLSFAITLDSSEQVVLKTKTNTVQTLVKNKSKNKYIAKWQSTITEFGFYIHWDKGDNQYYSSSFVKLNTEYYFPSFVKLNNLYENIKLCDPKWKEMDNCMLNLLNSKTVSIDVRSPQYTNKCCYPSHSDKSIKPSFANLNLNADLSATQLKQLFLITELLQATSNKINILIDTTNCENTLAETLEIASTLYNASKKLHNQGFNKYKHKAGQSDVQNECYKTITLNINSKQILNFAKNVSHSDQAKLNHVKSTLMDNTCLKESKNPIPYKSTDGVPNDSDSWITIKNVDSDPVYKTKQVIRNKCNESIVISRLLSTSSAYQPWTLKNPASQPSQIDVAREDIRIEVNTNLVSELELIEAFQNLNN